MEAKAVKSDPGLDSSTAAGTDFSSILFIWHRGSRFGTSWFNVSHSCPEETWGIKGTASLVSPQMSTETQHLTVLSSFMNDFRMEIWMSLIFEVCMRCIGKRSEEHTSELQSHSDLVCRLLLEK